MAKLRRIVVIAVAALLTLTFLDRFVLLPLLAERIGWPLGAAIVEGLAAIGAGFLARRFRRDVVLNFVIGYPVFGTVCFLVGLLKVNVLIMAPIVIVFAIVGGYSVGQTFLSGRPDKNVWPTLAVAVIGFIAAQAPPTTLDEVA